MPLPEPIQSENENEFIQRCMSDPTMNKEYPDLKQRSATCHSQFKEIKDGDNDSKQVKKDQLRIDYTSIDNKEYMIEKFVTTPEGYLRGRAVITNVGVFPYKMNDGSTFYELRPPEEVFAEDAIDSFKMLPFTNEHPSERVASNNIKKYQSGYCGDNILHDEFHLSNTITITDEEAIAEVQMGKRGISCGYTCDVEETSGVWMGTAYDRIQRNIRGNHVSMVERGRAGDAARMKMDSIDSSIGIRDTNKNINKKGESQMALKKMKIDGVEYEAEAEVVKSLTISKNKIDELSEKIDGLDKNISKLEGERDQYKDECTQLKEDVKKNKKDGNQNEVIEAAVQSRLIIFDAAKRAGVKIKKDFSEKEMKKEIIIKLFPNSKVKLDEAEDTYIDARFDVALEHLDTADEEEDIEDVHNNLSDDSIARIKSPKYSADAAYQKSVERLTTAWERKNNQEVN